MPFVMGVVRLAFRTEVEGSVFCVGWTTNTCDGLGFAVFGWESRFLGVGFRIQGVDFGVWFVVWGLWFGDENSGFRFRVQDSAKTCLVLCVRKFSMVAGKVCMLVPVARGSVRYPPGTPPTNRNAQKYSTWERGFKHSAFQY